MSATKTNGFVAPDGSTFDFMDYRIPTPGSGDEGKVPMYVGSTYFQWTKHVSAAEATATASTESYAASQGYGELSATLADVNPHGLIKVLYSYTPSQSFAVRFANDGNTYRSIKYRGAWLNTNDTGIIKSGDTALLWYDGNVLHLISVDRAAQHKTILHNEVFGRGDFNVYDGFYFPNAIRDVDGNWYGAVILGDQVWMAENLRTKHFGDLTSIAYGGENYSSETPYYYYPFGQSSNEEDKGLLYNHAAVMNGETPNNTNPSGIQGVSPTGWHIPSSSEFQQLISYLSSNTRYLSDGVTSSFVAKALAATQGWTASSTTYDVGNNQAANNISRFNAKPAGGMALTSSNTVYYDCPGQACFYSSSYYGGGPSIQTWRLAASNDKGVFYWGRNANSAHSVRCVCDMAPEQFIDWYVKTYGSMQHHLASLNIMYGESSTALATQTKTADVEGFSMTEGETFIMLLKYGWSSNQYMMFNINGLGAKVAYGLTYYYSLDYPIGANSRLLVTYHTDGGGYFSYINLSAGDSYIGNIMYRLSDLNRLMTVEIRNQYVAPEDGTTSVTIGVGAGDISVNSSGQNERIIIDNRNNTSDVTITATGIYAATFTILTPVVGAGKIAFYEMWPVGASNYVHCVDK